MIGCYDDRRRQEACWTATLDTPSIQASLLPLKGLAFTLDFGTISGFPAIYSNDTIASGYYTLTLQLLENGIPVMGAVEIVRIVAGQTTSGTYAFNDLSEDPGHPVLPLRLLNRPFPAGSFH